MKRYTLNESMFESTNFTAPSMHKNTRNIDPIHPIKRKHRRHKQSSEALTTSLEDEKYLSLYNSVK